MHSSFATKKKSVVGDVSSGSRVIIMTEANSLVKSKALKFLPKLKPEETEDKKEEVHSYRY